MSQLQGLNGTKKVLKCIEETERELTPKEIAEKTHVNHSSVRIYCRRLLQRGKIAQPWPGAYCSIPIHGMVIAPLRTHNLLFTADTPWLNVSDDVVEYTGAVKVRIQYGLKRKKITVRISCDQGMDRHAVNFAVNRALKLIEKKVGRSLDNLVLKTFEVNRDFEGVRLDGAQCLTKKGLFDVIERVYQKGDAVRAEWKVSDRLTLDEFVGLLRGGTTQYNLVQGLFMLVKKLDALVDVVKFQNREILELKKRLENKKDVEF